ncbi:MAG: transcriptional regulator of arginine metabolism [Acidobacteriota bacterium]|jgi:transcriptional regulator of arginine metabolism|nr:transcriptional regulator of arginine metabolism [Acidobacteriota bacterium]
MPSSREDMEKRRLGIVKILQGDEPVGQQKEIVEKLREMGISATQSSVSRDLTDLGAFRINDRWLLTGMDEGGVFEKVAKYVKDVRPAGPHLTLLVTEPGAGPLVAQAIEESKWDEIEGTVAGLNSVLIPTRDAMFQKLLLQRLQVYLRDNGVEEDKGKPRAQKPS